MTHNTRQLFRSYLANGILLAIAVFLIGCSQQGDLIPFYQPETEETGYYGKVVNFAGSQAGQQDDIASAFLPYPGNWTDILYVSDGQRSTTGLNALVLGKSLAQGSTFEINPVGVISLSAGSQVERIIIAVPSDSSLVTMPISGFSDLLTDYEPVRNILQMWFLNYQGTGTFKLVGWNDEREALRIMETVNGEGRN